MATERLLRSSIVDEAFELHFLDLSDREGGETIGHLTMHNVVVALRHAWRSLVMVLRHRPAAMYIPIDRGFWGFLRDCALMLPARLLGVRVVAHLRAGRFDLIHDYGLRGRLLARIGLAATSRLLVLGDSLRDLFDGYAARDKVAVVPNGIALGADVLGRIGERSDELRIAYVGNLFRDKGAHVMLEALAIALRANPRLRVTFAGDWLDEAYRRECLAIVERHRLNGSVTFAGRLESARKWELLRRSDLLCFTPVKPEGSPWVVLEAMAMGLAVIGTPQGTMSETIVEGETGHLVPIGDAAALAARLLELAADRDRLEAMGRAARGRIEEVFSEEATLRRLVGAIRSVLPGTGEERIEEGYGQNALRRGASRRRQGPTPAAVSTDS